jgi:hypothetical protein
MKSFTLAALIVLLAIAQGELRLAEWMKLRVQPYNEKAW